MKRIWIPALLAVLCACGHSAQPGVLRIADLANPSSLNPLLAHDQETIGDNLLFVQTLTGIDEHNRVVPLLLTQVPTKANGGISADGKRISYRLRRHVQFADGAELTSADVRFTYNAIIDNRNPVLTQEEYRRIASLQTPDRYTVVVNLKRPWNAAVNDLFAQSDFAFGILPEHAFRSTVLQGADWENHAFGTGPFRVVEWRRGDRIVLEPNPYFSPKPKLARIELRIFADTNSAVVALRTHEVDSTPLRSAELLAQGRRIAGVSILATPLNDTEFLDLQTQGAPTDRYEVRRAIASALNLKEISKTYGGIFPAAGSFLPPVMGGVFDPSIRPYPYDPSIAKRLTAHERIDLVYILQAGTPIGRKLAALVQQELQDAGFHVSIKEFSTTLFNAPEGALRNGRFNLAFGGWLGGADPEQTLIFTCDRANVNGDNVSRFCDRRFDALFADQAVTQSATRRRQDFIEMQRMLHDRIPTIPLYYETWYDGVSTRVHGFARNMLEFPVGAENWSVTP